MDRLTGAADLGELMRLEAEFDQAARAAGADAHYGLALVDITALRSINSRHGSDVGDAVLVYVAEQLRQLCPGACVARVGGDKFAVLVNGFAHSDMSQLKRQIKLAINGPPVDLGGQLVRVHVHLAARSGPRLEFKESRLLWGVERDAQVERQLEFDHRLNALEKHALVTVINDRADQRDRLEKLEQIARRNQTSGALSRFGLEEILPSMTPPYALAFIDVDNFGQINKSQDGAWAAGDQALVGVARLLSSLSPSAVVAHPFGDEFQVLLPGFTCEQARTALQALLEQPESLLRVGDLPITFSGGVAEVAPGSDYESALAKAMTATLEAKRQGKSKFVIGD